MNRLKTNINGKFPLVLDDLRWIDSGISEALESVFSAYNEDYFIISGCELAVNPGTGLLECSAGFIHWNGEILYTIGGAAMSDESNTPVFDLEITYDPAGLKTFGNDVQNNTYEIRRAKYESVAPASTGGKLIASTAKRLPELINERINDLEEDWRYIGQTGQPDIEGDWTTPATSSLTAVCFKKDVHGNVYLRGQAQDGTGSLFILPASYRPLFPMYFTSVHPTSSDIVKITIQTNGTVGVFGAGSELNLDGISFKTN
jgi:hypothetical protein